MPTWFDLPDGVLGMVVSYLKWLEPLSDERVDGTTHWIMGWERMRIVFDGKDQATMERVLRVVLPREVKVGLGLDPPPPLRPYLPLHIPDMHPKVFPLVGGNAGSIARWHDDRYMLKVNHLVQSPTVMDVVAFMFGHMIDADFIVSHDPYMPISCMGELSELKLTWRGRFLMFKHSEGRRDAIVEDLKQLSADIFYAPTEVFDMYSEYFVVEETHNPLFIIDLNHRINPTQYFEFVAMLDASKRPKP